LLSAASARLPVCTFYLEEPGRAGVCRGCWRARFVQPATARGRRSRKQPTAPASLYHRASSGQNSETLLTIGRTRDRRFPRSVTRCKAKDRRSLREERLKNSPTGLARCGDVEPGPIVAAKRCGGSFRARAVRPMSGRARRGRAVAIHPFAVAIDSAFD